MNRNTKYPAQAQGTHQGKKSFNKEELINEFKPFWVAKHLLDPSSNYIVKLVNNTSTGRCVKFFLKDFNKSDKLYVELINFDRELVDANDIKLDTCRQLYYLPDHTNFEKKYAEYKTQVDISGNMTDTYAIPISFLKLDIEEPLVHTALSIVELSAEDDILQKDLTARDMLAINHLYPCSTKPWLNELVKKIKSTK